MSNYGEQARHLAASGRLGTLSTLSCDRPGWPFGSLALYAADECGRPVFLFSALAVHTRNLLADPRASLLVMADAAGDPLASPRLTLLGPLARVPQQESGAARSLYLERHPQARAWAEFTDFHLYRLEVEQAYFVGGFGAMGWITGGDYAAAL